MCLSASFSFTLLSGPSLPSFPLFSTAVEMEMALTAGNYALGAKDADSEPQALPNSEVLSGEHRHPPVFRGG